MEVIVVAKDKRYLLPPTHPFTAKRSFSSFIYPPTHPLNSNPQNNSKLAHLDDSVKGYILSELNVWTVSNSDEVEKWSNVHVEPNNKLLGKRLGKDRGKVGKQRRERSIHPLTEHTSLSPHLPTTPPSNPPTHPPTHLSQTQVAAAIAALTPADIDTYQNEGKLTVAGYELSGEELILKKEFKGTAYVLPIGSSPTCPPNHAMILYILSIPTYPLTHPPHPNQATPPSTKPRPARTVPSS